MATTKTNIKTYQQAGMVANAYHTINNLFASTRLASDSVVTLTDATLQAANKASEAIANAKFN